VGAATFPYVWDVAEGSPLLLANLFTDYVTGPGGLPLEQITGSTATFYTHDELGSTRLLTNASGASVGTYTYSPYGMVTAHTGSVSTALQFAGQFTDNESGFQYLRARYYDPATAQFLSVDPLVQSTGQPYSYGNGNPVNHVDPSGLDATSFLDRLPQNPYDLAIPGACEPSWSDFVRDRTEDAAQDVAFQLAQNASENAQAQGVPSSGPDGASNGVGFTTTDGVVVVGGGTAGATGAAGGAALVTTTGVGGAEGAALGESALGGLTIDDALLGLLFLA